MQQAKVKDCIIKMVKPLCRPGKGTWQKGGIAFRYINPGPEPEWAVRPCTLQGEELPTGAGRASPREANCRKQWHCRLRGTKATHKGESRIIVCDKMLTDSRENFVEVVCLYFSCHDVYLFTFVE